MMDPALRATLERLLIRRDALQARAADAPLNDREQLFIERVSTAMSLATYARELRRQTAHMEATIRNRVVAAIDSLPVE